MFETLGLFELLLTSVCGVIAGMFGCWQIQAILRWRQGNAAAAPQTSSTPAIDSAAQAKAPRWSEPEQLLIQVRELFEHLDQISLPAKATQLTKHGRQAISQLQDWLQEQKNGSLATKQHDTAAALKQRAAEDELVLQWLNDKPTSAISSASRAVPESAPPELALAQIASELLPFNPIAVRLIGKTAEAEMSAAVERIEKLLASVDPPESMGKMPAALEPAPAIRDPQARYHPQAEDQQRRRSDQAIIYDTLLRRCLGDDDFAWRMLHKFPPRCRMELESLATEIRRRAWTAATCRITQLRGMAANLAADNLRDALANLEHVCRQQSATRADQLLEGVYGEFQQFLDFVARAGGEHPSAPFRNEENQPLSRWPAAMLPAEDHAPLSLDLHPAARVS